MYESNLLKSTPESCTCERSCPCIQSQAPQCTADGSSLQFWGRKNAPSSYYLRKANAPFFVLGNNVTPELHCDPAKLLPIGSHVKIYSRQRRGLEMGSKSPLLATFSSGSNANASSSTHLSWQVPRTSRSSVSPRAEQDRAKSCRLWRD